MDFPVAETVTGILSVLTSGGFMMFILKGLDKKIDSKVNSAECEINRKYITNEFSRGDKKFEKLMAKMDTHAELLARIDTTVKQLKEMG